MLKNRLSDFPKPQRCRLTKEDIKQRIREKKGVYMVYLGGDRNIPRFLAADRNGILAYGKSENLRKRVGEFLRSLSRLGGHHEGNLLCIIRQYAKLRGKWKDTFADECSLRVAWKYSSNAQKKEQELLRNYLEDFGELPPLNSAIPDRKTWIMETKKKVDKTRLWRTCH